MNSPFPGMDPYLEQHWRDVHHSLCTYARDALQPQIRPALLARVDERLVVETEAHDWSISPDVMISQRRPQPIAGGTESAVGVAEPLMIKAVYDPVYEGFVQIIDPASGGKLVTVIEFLSISNKRSRLGIEQYRSKVNEAIDAGVSVVEIDLLRGGEWVRQVNQKKIPQLMQEPYRACVRCGWNPTEFRYYHFPIRQRLLKLPIPLREGDKEALLDLQELIDRIYINGAYEEINYQLPPVPAFDEATAKWAQGLIASQRR